MSLRENLELYGLPDPEGHVHTLTEEQGATPHPGQGDAYILDGLPFHAPRPAGDHLSILSFNYQVLPGSLIDALVDHPEWFPDEVWIGWTLEQDLIVEATLGELRGQAEEP